MILFFVIACKKYPEDDVFIQCKRPEKRLIKWSPWTFEKLYENDVDISTLYMADSAFVQDITFEAQRDGYNDPHFFGTCMKCGFEEIGGFELTRKNKSLKMEFTYFYIFPEYGFIYSGIEWEIRALDKDKLILETWHNGKKYRIEYKN